VELNKNVLIGTVGYHNLANHSVGPILLPDLLKINWPEKITIEELHWGPIAIVQNFETLEEPFDRIVILTALETKNRKIGDITIHQWAGGLPSEEDIQARVCDAVTGVIGIENLLVIGEHFNIWPEEVYLVDVEPGPEKYGDRLDEDVEKKSEEIIDLVKEIALYGFPYRKKVQYLWGDSLTA
jgi:hypothetical protein